MAYKFPSTGATKRTLNISNFRGLDFASSPFDVAASRSPDSINLIPAAGGFPETRPGAVQVADFGEQINGIHNFYTPKGKVRVVHHGGMLDIWAADGSKAFIGDGLANAKSSAVQLGGKLLLLDGKQARVVQVDDDGEVRAYLLSEKAYAPTTTIGRKAGERTGGSALEAVNLLTPRRMNSFCVADEEQTELYLDSTPVAEVIKVEQLLENGLWVETEYQALDKLAGKLTFDSLAKTPVSGMDNYRVTYAPEHLSEADRQAEQQLSEAARVDELGVRVWIWTSNDKEIWAKKYWFTIGEDLPEERIDGIISANRTFYQFAVWYDRDSEEGKAYPRQYPFSITAEEGVKEIVLGYPSSSYDSDEADEAREYNKVRCEVELVKEGGVWYLTVVQPHGQCGGSYSGRGSQVYDAISAVTLSWREGEADAAAEKINGCTVATLFGVGGNADRAFITGNGECPNMDYMSGFEDITYFPDDGWTKIGSEGSAVVGYSWLSDGVLAIHKEESAGDSTIWYRSGSLNDSGEAIFTLTQGAVGVGAVSAHCFAHFGTDNLLLSRRGVYAVTHAGNEAQNERYAALRSWFINPKLCQEEHLSEAVAISWQDRYYLAAGEHIYVADIKAGSSYESRGGGYQYDWWLWAGLAVRVWYADEGEQRLLFGAADGKIYALTGECYDELSDGSKRAIECHWLTPVLDFGTHAYYKKIKNSYVTAEPYGRSAVRLSYILKSLENQVLDERMSVFDFSDMDFEDFAFETDSMPRNLASGGKAKKVMFAQFRMSNEPGRRFGIYGLTVLYTVGGKYKG